LIAAVPPFAGSGANKPAADSGRIAEKYTYRMEQINVHGRFGQTAVASNAVECGGCAGRKPCRCYCGFISK
jgi:hypothetical protein